MFGTGGLSGQGHPTFPPTYDRIKRFSPIRDKDTSTLMKMSQYPSLDYGKIFEYLSLWSEVQFLNIKKKTKKSKKSKNLTNLDFTPGTCQKIEKCQF